MTDPDRSQTMDLVEQAKQGDETAANDLFRRYYERVRRHAHRRVGDKLRRDVDSQDIAQESLIVAARKLPQFDMETRTSLMRWLRVIVENQIRDRVVWQNAECRRRAREVAVTDWDETPPGSDRDEQSPVEELARKERHQAIQDLLDQLDPRYSALIRARHFEGMGWQQIAERFGRPSADAARMMYQKALADLGLLARRQAEGDIEPTTN